MFTNWAPVSTSVSVIVLSPEPARARETPPIAAATRPATIAVMSMRPRLRLSVFIGQPPRSLTRPSYARSGRVSSPPRPILRSPDRLKSRPAAISRSADDSASDWVYLGAVSERTLGIGGIRIDPISLDRAVAVLLTVMLQIEVWVTGPVPHQWVVALLGPLVTLAVAVRRLHPVAVGVGAGLVGDVVAGVWGPPSLLSYGLAWICCMYGFAVWSPPRPFAIGLTVIAAGGLVSAVGPVTFKSSVQFVVVSTVVILLVNRVVGDRERRAQIAERERDLASREAVVEERARIARELHDVIAHHVSMIVLQAGAERRVLEQVGSDSEVLETIERTGRSALTETRRLLGMLRAGDHEPLAPQPRLSDVPLLIGQV